MNIKSTLFLIAVILAVFCLPERSWTKTKRIAINVNAAIVIPNVEMDFYVGYGLALHTSVGLINPLITDKDPIDFLSSNFGLRLFIYDNKNGLDGMFVGLKFLLGKLPDRGKYTGFAFELGGRIIFYDNYTFNFTFSFGAVDPEIVELHDISNVIYGDISVGFGIVF